MNNHSYLIEQIRERLLKLKRSNWSVTFVWVKAHAGILGNEMADQLAKTTARDEDMTTSFEYAVPGTRRRIQTKMATKLGG